MPLWKRGQNVTNTLENPNGITWQYFFSILKNALKVWPLVATYIWKHHRENLKQNKGPKTNLFFLSSFFHNSWDCSELVIHLCFSPLMPNNLCLYDGHIVGSVLDTFVPIVEASKHAKILTHLFQVIGTIARSCSHQTKMAMFGNKHSHNFTTNRWVLNLFIAMYTCLLFAIFIFLTSLHVFAEMHWNTTI
jgi:hypothetical protein